METQGGWKIIKAYTLQSAASLALDFFRQKNKLAEGHYGFVYGQVKRADNLDGADADRLIVATKEYDATQRMHFIQYMDGNRDWIYE